MPAYRQTDPLFVLQPLFGQGLERQFLELCSRVNEDYRSIAELSGHQEDLVLVLESRDRCGASVFSASVI